MKLFNRHVHSQAGEYLDGRLYGAARARFERHLATCADCAARLEDQRLVKSALSTLRELPAPRSFVLNEAMVAAAAPPPPPRRAAWQPFAAPAGALAMLFVLLLGGDLATSGGDEDEELADAAFNEGTLDTDELASDEAGGAVEPLTEQEAPIIEADAADGDDSGADSAGDGDDTLDGEAAPESDVAPEEPGEDELAEQTETESLDQNSPPAGEDLPGEPIEELQQIDDDDDNFRLYIRIIEAVLAAGAIALGFLAFRRWREQSAD
ncbi:MAG: zf-HC2 domain-containing protein [Dehalococcoidia bacterium]